MFVGQACAVAPGGSLSVPPASLLHHEIPKTRSARCDPACAETEDRTNPPAHLISDTDTDTRLVNPTRGPQPTNLIQIPFEFGILESFRYRYKYNFPPKSLI